MSNEYPQDLLITAILPSKKEILLFTYISCGVCEERASEDQNTVAGVNVGPHEAR